MPEISDFYKKISNKFIILFGTGTASNRISNSFPFPINYYIDNDQTKWDSEFNNIKVYCPSKLLNEPKDKIAIIIASMYYDEISQQLRAMGFQEEEHFWNGYDLLIENHTANYNDSITTKAALYREKMRGTSINTVIDIGASNGMWSKMAFKYFPEAFYYLIEAQNVHLEALMMMKETHLNVDYMLAAAGDSIGEIYFAGDDPFGGVASYSSNVSNCITVPMITVDHCVAKHSLKPPYLLKLDTHGFEVPIFEGAKKTLKDTAVIVVEVYNFKLGKDAFRFHEICSYLESLGFWLADICDPLRRPNDNILWQMDFVFISKEREEFKCKTYS